MLLLFRKMQAYFFKSYYNVFCLQLRIRLLYAADTHGSGAMCTEQNSQSKTSKKQKTASHPDS